MICLQNLKIEKFESLLRILGKQRCSNICWGGTVEPGVTCCYSSKKIRHSFLNPPFFEDLVFHGLPKPIFKHFRVAAWRAGIKLTHLKFEAFGKSGPDSIFLKILRGGFGLFPQGRGELVRELSARAIARNSSVRKWITPRISLFATLRSK